VVSARRARRVRVSEETPKEKDTFGEECEGAECEDERGGSDQDWSMSLPAGAKDAALKGVRHNGGGEGGKATVRRM
jgi:hypothetical protein